MPAVTQVQPSESPVSEERQVEALLRLVEDLGYQVDVTPAGDWTVSVVGDLGEQTIISFDTAREVVGAAKALAESLHVDLETDPLRAAG
jgi:H2-forming N5,N10-methylenetetrahydromethanopterin dehydrogenase-like enzyme